MWFKIFLCVVVFFRTELGTCKNANNVCSTLEAYFQNISTNTNCWYDADVDGGPIERARNNGYELERHELRTDDGYILDLYRFQSPNGGYGNEPLLFLHGLTSDCNYFMGNKQLSLAFFLVAQGFDVWLGNFRASIYSRHESLSRDDPEYWNFSMDEHAVYDTPAFIDHIANATNKNITIIGHSMGSTVGAMFSAYYPENSYVKHVILLSPTIFMRNVKGLLVSAFTKRLLPIMELLPKLNYHVLFKMDSFERSALNKFCFSSLENVNICLGMMELAGGPFSFPVGADIVPMVLGTLKCIGTRELLHYFQLLRTGGFHMYDYGPRENMIRYNSVSPPDYNFSAIKIPISIFYGLKDYLATKKDTIYLYEKYGKKNWDMYEIPYNHFDVFLSKSVKKIFFPLLLKSLNKYVDN